MAERRFGNISLNGKSYRIDLASYRARDIVDFAPKAQVPGGSIIYNELGLYQPLLMTDWSQGFGFQWHTTDAGYLRTEGLVDTRQKGLAMLMTEETQSETHASAKSGFLSAKISGIPTLFSWHATGVRRYDDTGGWIDISPVVSTKVNYLWFNGKYFFAAVDNDRIYYASNPLATSDWAVTGIDSDAIDYKWLAHHDGFVYAGKDADGSGLHGNEVYYDDSITLADLHGEAAGDPTMIPVGVDGWQTLGAFSFQGDIYVPRPDGLYRINKDKSGATNVLDFSDVASTDNFASWAIFNAALHFPIRDTIYRWNGVSLAPITPPRLTDTFPYTTYGSFSNFKVIGAFLVVTARASSSAGDLDVLCFDGAAWHRLYTLVAGAATATALAAFYDSLTDRLWTQDYNGSTYVTSYVPFNSRSPFPYADFPTTGQNSLISSRIDAGFRLVPKSTPSILVEASNCDANHYLKIFYSIDGGSWKPWGGVDGESNVVQEDGVIELKNPLGTDPSTIEYYHLNIRVDFVTTIAAQTPVLEGLMLRLIMRPEVLYGYAMQIVASRDSESGLAQDVRPIHDILRDLRLARSSNAPIQFKDPFGTMVFGYISSITEQAVEEEASELEGGRIIEHRVVLNFVEVG